MGPRAKHHSQMAGVEAIDHFANSSRPANSPCVQPMVVTQEQAGMRLDRLVASHLGLSRRCARLLISAGRVLLGGRTCRILTRTVNMGTKIAIVAEPTEGRAHAKPAAVTKAPHLTTPQVLFADRWLIAVNKPAGLLSEADRFEGPCVISWLGAHLRRDHVNDKLWLVHRLDAGTSGVLLLARHRGTAAALSELFRERAAKKRYLALVQGTPGASTTRYDGAIARVAGTRHGVREGGKGARTDVTVLCATSAHALVQAEPLTGRTHQIRVHLSHGGHPIMGDRLYGGPGYGPQGNQTQAPAPIPRPMLHAAALSLTHPQSGQAIHLEAPVPQDFAALQAALGLGH